MSADNITIFAAFFAGLLSFISPCVLPLIPVYLGYLSGSTITGPEPPARKVVFSHALLFVGGFTLVFVTLGAFAGLLGTALFQLTEYMVWVGGVLLIIFGLHVLGIITIPIFNQQKRLEYGQGQSPSYVRSGLVGMTFAAGWTPCIGPILGAILTLGFGAQDIGRATFFLFVYSMGLAIPFLVTAWMLSAATTRLKKLNRFLPLIERVSGAFIILVGVLLLTGTFTWLNTLANKYTPAWLLTLG